MCITNNFSETTLKQIRNLEVNSQDMTDRELAEVLVRIKKIQDDLEWGYEKAVKALKERNYDSIELFPELESKVYLAEGRSSSTVNAEKVFNDLNTVGKIEEFFKVASIVKSRTDDEETLKVIENNSIKTVSEPSIAVRKMSKKELKENC